MEILSRLDSKILLFFTKASHRFQVLTGRTNYFLAKLCLLVLSTGFLLDILNYWLPVIDHKSTSLCLFGSGLGMAICGWHLKGIVVPSKELVYYKDDVAVTFRIMVSILGFWFTLNLNLRVSEGVWLFHFIWSIGPYFLIPLFYFMAVDPLPLPPGKSKSCE